MGKVKQVGYKEYCKDMKTMYKEFEAGKREGAVQAHKVLRHLMKCKEDKDIINKELKKLEEMGVER